MRVIADARLTEKHDIVERMRRDGGLDLTVEILFSGMTFRPWFITNNGEGIAFTHHDGACVTHILVVFPNRDMLTAQVKLLVPGPAEGWLFGPHHGGRAYDFVVTAARQPVTEVVAA